MCPRCGAYVCAPPEPLAERSRLAVASFVLGIAAFVLPPLALAAVIAGDRARDSIRRRLRQGDELARWGMVLGVIAGGLWAMAFLALGSSHTVFPF